MNRLSDTPEWRTLEGHARQIASRHLRELFADDPQRGPRLTRQAGDWRVDFSKNRIVPETVDLLVALAEARGLTREIERMFTGQPINATEHRAVLHTALRSGAAAPLPVDGVDVLPEVREVLARMGRFATRIRSGEWRGHTGRPIRTVINIGIGGSDLGPGWR